MQERRAEARKPILEAAMDNEGRGEETVELEEGREDGPRWAQLEEEVRVVWVEIRR